MSTDPLRYEIEPADRVVARVNAPAGIDICEHCGEAYETWTDMASCDNQRLVRQGRYRGIGCCRIRFDGEDGVITIHSCSKCQNADELAPIFVPEPGSGDSPKSPA